MDWQSAAGKSLKEKWSTERTGRSTPKLLGRTGPGRTKPGPAIDGWRIFRELSSGESAVEAATTFKMGLRTVSSRGKEYHLDYGSVFIADMGEPFTHAKLTAIREAAGYSQAAFERAVELKPRTATSPNGYPEGIRVPEIARPVIGWRNRVIRAMAEAKRDKERGYHTHEVIHTLLPDLESLCGTLVETFGGKQVGRYAKPGGIQAELIAHPDWTIENVWHFTAENARLYGRGSPWFRTACVMHELEEILKPRLDALRNTDSVTGFVFEVLGERYGVHPDRIKRAKGPTRTIQPAVMYGLVQDALASAPAPEKRGAKSGPRDDTRERIQIAAALVKIHKHNGTEVVWKDHASRLGGEAGMYVLRSTKRVQIQLVAETMTFDKAAAILERISKP